MTSRRTNLALLFLLVPVLAGGVWFALKAGGDDGRAVAALPALPGPGQAPGPNAGGASASLSLPVEEKAGEAVRTGQRSTAGEAAAGGAASSPWVSRVPRDAKWLRGHVEFPPETPPDEELWVIAEGARFFDADDSPRRHRAKVDREGNFQVAVGGRTPAKAKIWVRGRYLYLAEPEFAELQSEEELVLEPLVGGCLEVTVLPPRLVAFERGVLDGVEVRTDLGRFRERDEKEAVQLDESTFRLGGLPSNREWTIQAISPRFADGRAEDMSVEPGTTRRIELALVLGAKVSGTVVDALGHPVAEAKVEIHDGNQPDIPIAIDLNQGEETLTNSDGEFAVRGVPPGNAVLSVKASGFLDYRFELGELADGSERAGLVARLEQGEVVAGFVRWPDGTPAAGATVRLSQTRAVFGDFRAPVPIPEILTEADGSFAFPGLTEGNCDVAATAIHPDDAPDPGSKLSRLQAKKLPRWIARQTGVEPGTRGVDLVLTAGESLTGEVTDDLGQPIKNFSVVASPSGEGLLFQGARRPIRARFSDENGRFALEGLIDGTWDLRVNAMSHAEAPVRTIEVPSGRTERFVLPRAAKIEGVVQDPTGETVSRAEVEYAVGTGGFDDDDKADSDGEFTISELTPGRVRLRARADGFARSEIVLIDVAAGEKRDGVLLVLQPGAILSGVLHPDEDPRSGRSVRLRGPASRNVNTDGGGRFRFEGLDPGRYTVSLQPEGGRGRDRDEWILNMTQRRELEVEIGAGDDMDVVLGGPSPEEVRISGRVLKKGEPVGDALVLATADGEQQPGAACRTDSEGAYELAVDHPGIWRFRVTRGGFNGGGAPLEVDVPAGDEVQLDLVIPEARLVGLVTGPDGSPLPGTQLSLSLASDEGGGGWFGRQTVGTNDAGEYTFEELALGEYDLIVGGSGFGFGGPGVSEYATQVVTVRIEDENEDRRADVRLQEAGKVVGTVFDGGGQPLAGARIEVTDMEGHPLSGWRGARSSADGSFNYSGVAGAVRVRARGGEGLESDWVEVDVPSGGEGAVTLTAR